MVILLNKNKNQNKELDNNIEELRENFNKARDLSINHLTAKKKTILSFNEKELKAFEDNPLNIEELKNSLYNPLSGELNGDENYEHYMMLDGTVNEKYQQKKAEELISSLNVVDDEVPFYKIPAAIKKDAFRKIEFGWIFFTIVAVTYVMAFVGMPMLLYSLFFALLLTYIGCTKLYIGKHNKYVKFEGIVVDVETYGLTKSTKYMVVKMSDGEKFLNAKLNVCKDIKPGLPITVYLPPNLVIVPSEFGPLAEYIIAYKLDISTDATDELLAEGSISADEYIRHDPISGEIRDKKVYEGTIASYNEEDLETISEEKQGKINPENIEKDSEK